MARSGWKRSSIADDSPVSYVSFQAAKKFFAVDISGSTWGSGIRAEATAVYKMHSNSADTVIKWDHTCRGTPTLVDDISSRYFEELGGGTEPAEILKHDPAVHEINSSDIWCLLTDGAIAQSSVTKLTLLADSRNLTHIPVILLIVGDKALTPEQTNISVGIPFYANNQEAIILFKDAKTGEIFVIAAKGAFSPLINVGSEPVSLDLSGWKSLPVYSKEASFMKRLEDLAIKVISHKDRLIQKSVSLGPTWEAATHTLVDVDSLLGQVHLESEDLYNLLEEEAINRLALICKTRDRLQDLRALLIRHKRQEISVRLEDRHGAKKILEDMQASDLTETVKNQLRERLREAHAVNRASYLRLIDSPNEQFRIAREINRLINRGLAILADIEKSGYTADLVNRKSNRARRAEMITSGDVDIHLTSLELSDSVDAFRSTCSICCGEDQIMSAVLKRLDTVEENTTDFALNFPLAAGQGRQNKDMISAQFICFQCALICQNSIFKEDLSAILPTVGYLGANKTYINHQLTLAITGGLSTGVSGIGQIFMTILDRTLETKDWCSDQSPIEAAHVDHEKRNRRLGLRWMLETFLNNCRSRENFNETGEWVAYPQALAWAINDFEHTGLDSWAIQYPLVGFNQLIRWYHILNLKISQDALNNLLKTKLVHHTVTVFMASLLRKKEDQEWRDPFLGLIYKGFNAPSIPRDRGTASIVHTKEFWSRLETALGQWSDAKQFLSLFDSLARTKLCRRVQLIIFWVLFTQKGHTTPKSFFQNLRLREPLAPAALDMTSELPESMVMGILLSIFCSTKAVMDTTHESSSIPPFVSPFGASVLGCGSSKCHIKFYSQVDLCPVNPDAIRNRRAEHLKEVYGVTSEFNASVTGLPERTLAPVPPSSTNSNLHISIARVWSKLDRSEEGETSVHGFWSSPARKSHLSKDAIMNGVDKAVMSFIREVRLEMCAVNHRGNIYWDNIEADVKEALPSFFEALRVGSKKSGLGDVSGLGYVHDWKAGNTLKAKIEYELSL